MCLQQLYEGEQSGIILILKLKQISDKYIRLKVRDAKHQDHTVCYTKEVLKEVQAEDIRWFTGCVCVNTPYWRRTLKPGRDLLVGRVDEMNMDGLIEPAKYLPDHTAHPV